MPWNLESPLDRDLSAPYHRLARRRWGPARVLIKAAERFGKKSPQGKLIISAVLLPGTLSGETTGTPAFGRFTQVPMGTLTFSPHQNDDGTASCHSVSDLGHQERTGSAPELCVYRVVG